MEKDQLVSNIAALDTQEASLLQELSIVRARRTVLRDSLQQLTTPITGAPVSPIEMWRERHIQQQQQQEGHPFKDDSHFAQGAIDNSPKGLHPAGSTYWADLAESMDKR